MNKSLFFGTFIYRYSVRCILNVYQRIQISVDMTLALKAHFSQNVNPHLTQIPQLAVPLMASDMRKRENDITLGIPKTFYTYGDVGQAEILRIFHLLALYRNEKICFERTPHPLPMQCNLKSINLSDIIYVRKMTPMLLNQDVYPSHYLVYE